MRSPKSVLLAVALVLLSTIDAFYLPGLAPNVFCKREIPDSKCKVSSTTERRLQFENDCFSLDETRSVC